MRTMSASSQPRQTREKSQIARRLSPPLAGLITVVVGAVLANVEDWSAGALWGIAVLAALVAATAFAVPAARRAPKLGTADSPHALTIGAAVASNPRESGELSPDLVIVLSGHARTGKTTIAKQLVASHPGWARASCGEFVRARARGLGINDPSAETDELGQRLVEELGGHAFLEAVLAHANVTASTSTLVVDDVYHLAVFEALEDRWAHLKFASVTLPPTTRRGLVGDAPHATAAGPLDEAVEALERRRTPDRRIPGAAGPDDTGPALEALGALAAA